MRTPIMSCSLLEPVSATLAQLWTHLGAKGHNDGKITLKTHAYLLSVVQGRCKHPRTQENYCLNLIWQGQPALCCELSSWRKASKKQQFRARTLCPLLAPGEDRARGALYLASNSEVSQGCCQLGQCCISVQGNTGPEMSGKFYFGLCGNRQPSAVTWG